MYVHVNKMVTISIRIEKALKEEMDRLSHLNWSEIIRQAIKVKINQEGQKNLVKAILINEKIRKIAPDGFDSTKIIREWRDRNFRIDYSDEMVDSQ